MSDLADDKFCYKKDTADDQHDDHPAQVSLSQKTIPHLASFTCSELVNN